jgi:hypothetical protein
LVQEFKQIHTATPPKKYCPEGMRSFAGQGRPAKIFDTAECMRIQLLSALVCVGLRLI